MEFAEDMDILMTSSTEWHLRSIRNQMRVVETNAYNESATYDLNGNIQTLLRFGGSDGNSALKIDDIKYTYEGNQLVDIWDSSGNSLGLDGGDAMVYDKNGNMIMDGAHFIDGIAYNHMNLPESLEKNMNILSILLCRWN
jgi:hypothetical protein